MTPTLQVKTTTGALAPTLSQLSELKIQVLPRTSPHSPQSSVPQPATATPTGPTLLPRLVIVQPTLGATPHPTPPATPHLGSYTVEDSEQMSTDHDLGGLLTPSESSFSGITDTSLSTVDTTDDAAASVKPSSSSTAAVAEAGAEPHPPEAPAVIVGESTILPRGHTRKSSTSSAPGGERTTQNRIGNAAMSRTRGAARSGGPGRLERTKSQGSSRSRSPGGPGRGVGLGGLMMTMTTVVVADSGEPPIGGGYAADKPKKATGATRVVGKRPGIRTRRTLSAGRVVSMAHAGHAGKGREKWPAFDIGSNSDESGGSWSHSKSVGSGSDTGKRVGHAPVNLGVPHEPSASLSPVHVPRPDPPPPVQAQPSQSRKMVLATDDSEGYETETDSDGVSEVSRGRDLLVDKGKSAGVIDRGDKPGNGGGLGEDDGGWASEETGDEDERLVTREVAGQKPGVSGGSGGRPKYQAQIDHHQQQPQGHYHQRPAAHQANLQQQYPGRHAKRLQAEAQARLAKHTVEHAALEAEHLRDMFVRKPVPSSEQLAAMRSKSVGLLTQLLNPDPMIFPVDHPYRRGFSSGEIAIQGGQGEGVGGSAGSGAVVDNVAGAAGEDSRSRTEVGARQRYGDGEGRMPRGLPSMAGVGAPGLKLTKSAAALPVASVGSVIAVQATKSDGSGRSPKASGSGQGTTTHVRSPDSGRWSNGMIGWYRPRGRPADQELDTESESEEEDGKGKKNSILMSKSVAQEKLKALAMKRGIKLSTGTHGDGNGKSGRQQEQEELEPVPEWAKSVTVVRNGSRERTSSRLRPQDSHPIQQQQQRTVSRQISSPPPVPIPVGHPYNLPLPAPPSTPRTTRRLMLQTEMSESLRRNLLWERQVSKNTMAGFRRTNSSGDASDSGSGRRGNVLGGGVQPFTGLLPPVVQLTPKKGKAGENENEAEEQPRKPLDHAELEKRALARTKTWANDFHFVGW